MPGGVFFHAWQGRGLCGLRLRAARALLTRLPRCAVLRCGGRVRGVQRGVQRGRGGLRERERRAGHRRGRAVRAQEFLRLFRHPRMRPPRQCVLNIRVLLAPPRYPCACLPQASHPLPAPPQQPHARHHAAVYRAACTQHLRPLHRDRVPLPMGPPRTPPPGRGAARAARWPAAGARRAATCAAPPCASPASVDSPPRRRGCTRTPSRAARSRSSLRRPVRALPLSDTAAPCIACCALDIPDGCGALTDAPSTMQASSSLAPYSKTATAAKTEHAGMLRHSDIRRHACGRNGMHAQGGSALMTGRLLQASSPLTWRSSSMPSTSGIMTS